MMSFMGWEIGDGNRIKTGSDAMVGVTCCHQLSTQILNFIHIKEFYTLHHIYSIQLDNIVGHSWRGATKLEVLYMHTLEWEEYIVKLYDAWIFY